VAGFVGTALEYYDFFIFATAASLVFGPVMFGGGEAAMLASFATLAVSYCARPLGGIIWGHLGDKLGRRAVLMATIIMMGVSTFLIGCLPTFAQAGWIAPSLLVLCRLLQGFSAGGESAGTSTLTMENAPDNRRNFYTQFTITGCNFGIVLANLVFIPISSLPKADLLGWGWRIPFLLSAIIMIIGYLVRRTLIEPEVFSEVKQQKKTARLPLVVLLRTDTPTLVKAILMMLVCATDSVFTAYALAYATQAMKIQASVMLWAVVCGMALGMIGQPLAGMLSDKIGRKPVFVTGCALSAAGLYLYFVAIQTTVPALIILAGIFYRAIAYSCVNAIYIGWFPELFHVKVRYSGVAIAIQFGLIVAGFSPMISAMLAPTGSPNWGPVPIFQAGLCFIAALAALFSRETYKTPLAELGIAPKE